MKLALQAPPLQYVRGSARADRRPVSAGLLRSAAPAVVYATLLFNFALCFLKTRGLNIGQVAVIGSEVAILVVAGLLIFPTVSRATVAYFLALVTYLGFLRYFNFYLDLKIGIDLSIPVLFWVLGDKYGDLKGADRIVVAAAVIMIAVGLFEWFALDEYQNYFNIFQYYVDKGSADAGQASFSGTKLFVSGIRPAGEGRELVPGLGNHRVSSILLEPVGAGSLGAILFLWALERFRARRVLSLWLIAGAVEIIVLADTRMGAIMCVVGLVARLIPPLRGRLILFATPAVMPFLILYVTNLSARGSVDNGFMGRIYSSGHLMNAWGPLQWMGLQVSPNSPVDSGYGYLISNFGILASLLVWGFATRRSGLPAARGFGLTTTLYYALGMCVSGATFSIKTAALIWFLNGVLAAQSPTADGAPAHG